MAAAYNIPPELLGLGLGAAIVGLLSSVEEGQTETLPDSIIQTSPYKTVINKPSIPDGFIRPHLKFILHQHY